MKIFSMVSNISIILFKKNPILNISNLKLQDVNK